MSFIFDDKLEELVGRRTMGYARASTDDQCEKDRNSMPRQLENFKIVANKLKLDLKDDRILKAEGESAKNSKNLRNPNGTYRKQLLPILSAGNVLLLENPDRFTRGGKHQGMDYLKELIERGITVIFTDTKENKFRGLKIVDKDNYEDDDILSEFDRGKKENTRKGSLVADSYPRRYEALKRGEFARVKTPTWIKNGLKSRNNLTPSDDRWYLIPERVAVVKRMYKMYLDGVSPFTIAKTLAKEGVASFAQGNKKWCRATIFNMLRDESVLGYYINKPHNIRIPNVFEPIIDRDTFDRVQVRIKERYRLPSICKAKPVIFGRGITKCSECGGNLIRTGTIKKPYLICGNRIGNCKSNTIRYDWFENSFKELLSHTEEILEIIEKEPETLQLDDDIAKAQTRIGQIKKQQALLVNDLTDLSLPHDAIKTKLRELTNEEKDCNKVIADARLKKYTNGISVEERLKDYRKLYETKWNIDEYRLKIRDCIRDITESVVVDLSKKQYVVMFRDAKRPVYVLLGCGKGNGNKYWIIDPSDPTRCAYCHDGQKDTMPPPGWGGWKSDTLPTPPPMPESLLTNPLNLYYDQKNARMVTTTKEKKS